MAASLEKPRQLTGWHVLGLFVGGFAIIIAVNVALAVNAVRTFPGLETDSAYIASQHFDVDRAAQDALGWDVGAAVEASALRLAITGADGAAVRPEIVSATLGRATHVAFLHLLDDVVEIQRSALGNSWHVSWLCKVARHRTIHLRIFDLLPA